MMTGEALCTAAGRLLDEVSEMSVDMSIGGESEVSVVIDE